MLLGMVHLAIYNNLHTFFMQTIYHIFEDNTAIITILLFLWILCYYGISHAIFINLEESYFRTNAKPDIIIWTKEDNLEAEEFRNAVLVEFSKDQVFIGIPLRIERRV